MKRPRTTLNTFLLTALILSQISCGKRNEDVESQEEGSEVLTEISDAGKTGSGPSQRSEGGASLDHVLTVWDAGDKDAAAEAFLSIPWDDPAACENVPLMTMSEQQFQSLSRRERDRTAKEYRALRDRLLVGIVRHVRSQADSALAAGNVQKAKAHYQGILRCGQALSSPDRLAIMKLDGEAAIGMAQKGLSSVE